ncbi:MAG: hypothetical protein K0U98_05820 [Deltaproteobacteria bacterium]|nr:hypothetical protein [Deltaproteobacteria bacterium]
MDSWFDLERYHEFEEFPPPLPRLIQPSAGSSISPGEESHPSPAIPMRPGCYLLDCRFYEADEANSVLAYSGTLRAEVGARGMVASADLYLRKKPELPPPSEGIPLFPIADYRFYLRLTGITLPDGHRGPIEATFERFSYRRRRWWAQERGLRVIFRPVTAPPDYPNAENYFQGEVLDEAGNTIGNCTLGWISEMLRRATIEIHTASGVEPVPAAIKSPKEVSLRGIFAEAGWELTVLGPQGHLGATVHSETSVDSAAESTPGNPQDSQTEKDATQSQPSTVEVGSGQLEIGSSVWDPTQLHTVLEDLQQKKPRFAREWRYILMCVPRLPSGYWGLMFDDNIEVEGSDSLPREAAAVAAHLTFPENSKWEEEIKGSKLADLQALYFRTAVHELGHTMGLVHAPRKTPNNGFMTRLVHVRDRKAAHGALEDRIHWSFSPQDLWRLRHFPDYTVRPGGQRFNHWERHSLTPYSAESPALDPKELQLPQLKVQPEDELLPLGAPIRLNFFLDNSGEAFSQRISLPNLSSGHLRITVEGSDGRWRRVRPLLRFLGENGEKPIKRGKFHWYSLTLLHGSEGPLCPQPGLYRVNVRWQGLVDDHPASLEGACSILVLAVKDKRHGRAALAILSRPRTLSILVYGGKEDRDNEDAISAALDSKVLKPHYQLIALEHYARLGRWHKVFNQNQFQPAFKLTGSTVSTPEEAERLRKLTDTADLSRQEVELLTGFLTKREKPPSYPEN